MAKPLLQLIAECKTRDDVVPLYAACLSQYDESADWRSINMAIVDKWSLSGLSYVKDRAWKLRGVEGAVT